MDSLINSISWLLLPLPVIFIFTIYFSQRKDRAYLETKPGREPLPRAHYDLRIKELLELKKKLGKLSLDEFKARESEIYFLERKANKVLIETEAEERKYYDALSHCQNAWIDYKEVYLEIGFWLRTLSPKRAKELQIFRKLYLETKFRADNEKEKILARERIWIEEAKNRILNQQADEKSSLDNPEQNQTVDNKEQGKVEINEKREEKQPVNQRPPEREIEQAVVPPSPLPSPSKSFDLQHFDKFYPNFENLNFEGDFFSLEELSKTVIKDAIFDGSIFWGIQFTGVQQFQDCSFRGSDFSGSTFKKADAPHRFLECDFSNAQLSDCTFEFVAFYNCSFRSISSENLSFKTIKFIDCSFEECDLKAIDFSQTVMSKTMFAEIDFSEIAHKPKNWRQNTVENDTDQSLSS